MPPETDQSREAKAIQLAEQRGRRQQLVDARLDGHDAHFARINGSLDRFGTRMEELEKGVGELRTEVGSLKATVLQSAKAALDNRTFLLTAAVLAVMIIGLFVTGGH